MPQLSGDDCSLRVYRNQPDQFMGKPLRGIKDKTPLAKGVLSCSVLGAEGCLRDASRADHQGNRQGTARTDPYPALKLAKDISKPAH